MSQERPKKRWDHQRWAEFMDKQGFYIAFGLCVATLIGTAIITQVKPPPVPQEQAQVPPSADPVQAMEERQQSLREALDAVIPTQTPAGGGQQGGAATEKRSAAETQGASELHEDGQPVQITLTPSPAPAKAKKFRWPVSGEVLQPFDLEALRYSETLDEWTTHSGVDIAGLEGDLVRAAADGKVAQARQDRLLGNVVILEHDDGLRTLYAGLSTLALVREGDSIQAGQSIGYMGNTATFESLMETHLHFEVLDGEERINPMDFLP